MYLFLLLIGLDKLEFLIKLNKKKPKKCITF